MMNHNGIDKIDADKLENEYRTCYMDGYNDGYSHGRDDGHEDGYSNGYVRGYRDCLHSFNESLSQLLGAQFRYIPNLEEESNEKKP